MAKVELSEGECTPSEDTAEPSSVCRSDVDSWLKDAEDGEEKGRAEKRLEGGEGEDMDNLSAQERRKRKRQQKKQDKKMRMNGGGTLVVGGQRVVRAEIDWTLEDFYKQHTTNTLQTKHAQELVLFALDALHRNKLPWLQIKNRPNTSKVVALLVDGLSAAIYSKYATKCSHLPSIFPRAPPLQFQGTKSYVANPLQSLLWVGIPQHELKKRVAASQADGVSNTALLCTREQLARGQYPALYPGWIGEQAEVKEKGGTLPDMTSYVKTKAYEKFEAQLQEGGVEGEKEEGETDDSHQWADPSDKEPWPMFPIDCEMCETVQGLELTRVSLLDENGSVLLDELVRPHQPITDYLTRWSGITPEMLNSVETRLADVQERIRALLPEKAILVGHGLDNDLKALKMVHPYLIDTAVAYPHPNGLQYKHSLRHLARTYLGRTIQEKEGGHDSTEDARAAIDLVRLKMQKGLGFGSPDSSLESIFARLNRVRKKGAMVAAAHNTVPHTAASSIPCTNDDEVASKTRQQAGNSNMDFVFAHMSELASSNEEDMEKCVAAVDQRIKSIYDALPTNALFVVVAGPGPQHAIRSEQKRQSCDPTWGPSDDANLNTLVMAARSGLLFATYK